jgi:predicted O-methyltransferase YrrM
MEIFLDSLAAMDFLTKKGSGYYNTSLAERFLLPGSPDYLGDNLKYQDLLWSNWERLSEVLQTGRVRRPLDQLLTRIQGPFVREYIRGMNNIARTPAKELAHILPLSQAKRLLDVGAGPGTFTRELLARHPKLQADILDLPRTLRLTRSFLSDLIAQKRVRLKPGNYHHASLGHGAYDLVLLSHVTHDEGPRDNAALVLRATEAVRPGGIVAVHDFILDDCRTRPSFSALFSVHMLISTRSGQVYSQKQYKDWMYSAGLTGIRRREICAGAPNATVLLLGIKEQN